MSKDDTSIRAALATDADAIATIYNHYILNSVATFEEQAIAPEQIQQRQSEIQSHALPWLLLEQDGQLKGYCYASPWNKRASYRDSVETTIYLSPQAVGLGLGHRLYHALFSMLRDQNKHVAIAGITLPNDASVALHEKMGMKKVAHFEQVGNKFGQWLDVGYWQVLLT